MTNTELVPLNIKHEDKTIEQFQIILGLAYNAGAEKIHFYIYEFLEGEQIFAFYNSSRKNHMKKMTKSARRAVRRTFERVYNSKDLSKMCLHYKLPPEFNAGVKIFRDSGMDLETVLKDTYKVSSFDQPSAPRLINHSGRLFNSTLSEIRNSVYQITIDRELP